MNDEYPYYGYYEEDQNENGFEFVIYFIEESTGTIIINENDGEYEIGEYAENWIEEVFVKITNPKQIEYLDKRRFLLSGV